MSVHFPFLTLLVFLPAAAAVLIALLPSASAGAAKGIAMVFSVATLVVAAAATVVFRPGFAGFQLVSSHPWVPSFGISWELGVDGISLFLVLLTAVLFPLAVAGASESAKPRSFLAWMMLLEAACMGSFLALDLFLFFVFFELTLVPTYFVIGGWGYAKRTTAALKFFLYTFLGSAFLLVGIVAVALLHKQATGHLTFSLPALAATPGIGGTGGALLFLAFTIAFAVKAPIFPLHTWSPDAYGESPTAGVVVLAGIMAKLGAYGIVRFDFELFPHQTMAFAPLLLTLAVIGIIYGAIVAARQKDLKRMMAYSSLAHLGFIVLGLFALTDIGVAGGVLQMVNHGLFTAALFLLIGMLYRRHGTWQADQLAGLQRRLPILAGVFTVVMMASIGLPGLAGFVGEFMILAGAFISHRWWAVVATTGVVFSAVYLLWAYQRVFHGPEKADQVRSVDLSWTERAVLAPLVALMIFIGVHPQPLLSRITPTVNQLVGHVTGQPARVQTAASVKMASPLRAGSSTPVQVASVTTTAVGSGKGS